jgi:DNA repair photolyase
VKNILDKGYKIGEFSSYRYPDNVLKTVANDLKKIGPNDKSTVIFCTTCDPCATPDHADITIEAIKLIMAKSNLQVRVLSKSILIKTIASALTLYKDRITYSLSTGTADERVSKAIEAHASPISKRVDALHWLQDNHFRTYGMICPVLPSEIEAVGKLVDQVRPEKCEHVWVEALNVRGKSLVKTYKALADAGLQQHAQQLKKVMGNKQNWLDYSKKLFLAFQEEMRRKDQLHKLRFLQYVCDDDREFFEKAEGAVCL